MKKRKLGNSGIEVAPLTFGGNVFGWTVDEKNPILYWTHLFPPVLI
jgi:aryl-alcohol dehydrogenase-like predicted oxidoreductase